jgi:nitrate reductase cytochrome c-type subunit
MKANRVAHDFTLHRKHPSSRCLNCHHMLMKTVAAAAGLSTIKHFASLQVLQLLCDPCPSPYDCHAVHAGQGEHLDGVVIAAHKQAHITCSGSSDRQSLAAMKLLAPLLLGC